MTSQVAISVLESLLVRWSAPILFNDPFDLQMEVKFGFTTGEFMEEYAIQTEKVVFSDSEPRGDQSDPIFLMMKALWSNRRSIPRKDFRRSLDELLSEGSPELGRTFGDWNKGWEAFISQFRLFCVAEEPDDLLMWAHYAERHKGVVMKLKCLPERDTALCAALPVIYQDDLFVLAELEQWVKQMTGQLEKEPGRDIFKRFVCTKSRHWSYEKEWRALSMGKKDDGLGYAMLALWPQEIDSLFLGCRIEADIKEQIVKRLRGDLQHVTVYQAKRSETRFGLDFVQIA